MVAYGTERTLVIKSKGWRYHKAGWEEIFKPVSETCTDPSGKTQSSWPGTFLSMFFFIFLNFSKDIASFLQLHATKYLLVTFLLLLLHDHEDDIAAQAYRTLIYI